MPLHTFCINFSVCAISATGLATWPNTALLKKKKKLHACCVAMVYNVQPAFSAHWPYNSWASLLKVSPFPSPPKIRKTPASCWLKSGKEATSVAMTNARGSDRPAAGVANGTPSPAHFAAVYASGGWPPPKQLAIPYPWLGTVGWYCSAHDADEHRHHHKLPQPIGLTSWYLHSVCPLPYYKSRVSSAHEARLFRTQSTFLPHTKHSSLLPPPQTV